MQNENPHLSKVSKHLAVFELQAILILPPLYKQMQADPHKAMSENLHNQFVYIADLTNNQ